MIIGLSNGLLTLASMCIPNPSFATLSMLFVFAVPWRKFKNGHDPKLALEQTIIGKVETAPAVDVESAHRYAKYITERSEHDVTHWFAWYKLPEVIELGDVAEFKDLKERFKVSERVLSEGSYRCPRRRSSDGLMVARGDLAVEIGRVNVPNPATNYSEPMSD